jgi:L-asparaginase II
MLCADDLPLTADTHLDFIPLIQLSRGGQPECLHYGCAAVVGHDGKLVASAGNPHWKAFTRSTLKALQALPFVQSGGPEQLGYTVAENAMLCASHNGEDMHVQAAESMLTKARLQRSALRCGCHVPGLFTLLDKSPPADLQFDERHNNCSGKHAGFLGYCVLQGWDRDTYLNLDHPLQKAIARDVARVAGMDVQDLGVGIDGCSAPNFSMPLSKLAFSYARLASGAQDPEFGDSFALLATAMTTHPEMVSGTGRNDLAFTQIGRGDWVTKIGADGMQVIASRSRRQALAIKIADGNKTALYAATVAALQQLGWADAAQLQALEPWRNATITNARGLTVGDRQAIFQLETP